MKRKTPLKYAETLYMRDQCNGAVSALTDRDIIDSRVRAFIDGVKWAKRQQRRSVGKT